MRHMRACMQVLLPALQAHCPDLYAGGSRSGSALVAAQHRHLEAQLTALLRALMTQGARELDALLQAYMKVRG
jgi:hypothetical protein